jgi:hypothetical protein
MKLHEAMVEVLEGGEWATFDEVADRIEARGLYRRSDGAFAGRGRCAGALPNRTDAMSISSKSTDHGFAFFKLPSSRRRRV